MLFKHLPVPVPFLGGGWIDGEPGGAFAMSLSETGPRLGLSVCRSEVAHAI